MAYTFWRRIFGTASTGAGARNDGEQITIPGAYSVSPASSVTLDTAMQVSAVWACVKLYCEIIGAMPLRVYNITNDVWREDTQHPLARLFGGRVNAWQTRPEFFETIVANESLQGNSYSLIQRNQRGEMIGLVPLMSEQMQVALMNGRLHYQYTDNGQTKEIPAESIWHTKRFGNGVVGLSVLGYARNTIGVAQAAENSVSRIYQNGAKPSGVLKVDKPLTPEQRAKARTNYQGLEGGTDDRLLVLEAGFDYKQISMTPEDIELLASRRYQVEDIARFFGVPSVLINDTTASTVWGSGVSQIVEGFYKLSLRPYLSRLEASIEQWLLTPGERASGNIRVRFDFEDFLQQSQAARITMYKDAIMGGFMTPNQARKLEGWEPVEGGDRAFMQQQMVPISAITGEQLVVSTREQKSKGEEMHLHLPEVRIPDISIPAPVIHYAPEVKFDAPAPQVTVRNEVATPDVQVNVAAPDVKVDVAAPAVSVTPEIAVRLPARKTETNVEYDGKDRIKRTTQIEKDA